MVNQWSRGIKVSQPGSRGHGLIQEVILLLCQWYDQNTVGT